MTLRPVSKPHLLLVEDDPDIVVSLDALLSEEGYSVTVATSLEEALARVDEQAFDAIISDLFRAGTQHPLDSLEPLRLRAMPTPIIVTSAWNLAREEARTRGFADFVGKPFDLDAVIAATAICCRTHLSPGQSPQARIIAQAVERVNRQDWEGLLALTADDVRFSPVVRPPLGMPGVMRGREAYRAHIEQVASRRPGLLFGTWRAYERTGDGLTVRCEASWETSGQRISRAGAVAVAFSDERISAIEVLQAPADDE